MALPTLHPIIETKIYSEPGAANTTVSRPGGLRSRSSNDILLATINPGVEEIILKAEPRSIESLSQNLTLRLWLWGDDVTATTYRINQIAALTYRGEDIRLDVRTVTGPWGRKRDHIELIVVQRQRRRL